MEFIPQTDIIGVCETWLKEGETIDIPGYRDFNFYNKNLHQNAKRGNSGITVYIHESVEQKCRILNGTENIVWVEILQPTGRPTAVAFIYFPPDHVDNEWFSTLERNLIELSSDYDTLMIGDFNAHTSDALDFNFDGDSEFDVLPLSTNLNEQYLKKRNTYDKRPVNNYGRQLLDICIASNHFILNGRAQGDKAGNFTRAQGDSKGVLDYVISNVTLVDKI